MRARLISEKFVEDSDPVKDMGIGLTPAEMILQHLIEKKGKTKIFWKLTPTEAKKAKWKYDLNYSLPMSIVDWTYLKNKMEWKEIPKKYIDKAYSWQYAADMDNFEYIQLFKEIFGGTWHYYVTELTQNNKTIVDLRAGITFKELVEEIQTSPALVKKPRK